MDPVTIAAISLGTTVLATGLTAYGQISAGQAQASQARYQAQVAANNAVIAQQNAAYAIQSGEARATDEAMKARQQQGAVIAALAASGMDVNTGSAVDIREGFRERGQLNVERTRNEAALRAYGYESQSSNFLADEALQQAAGRNARTAGFLKAGGTLLSGASSAIGTKWGSLKVSGTPIGEDADLVGA